MIFYHLCFDNGQNLELDLADVQSMSAFVHKLRNFYPKLLDSKALEEAINYFNALVEVSCKFHSHKVTARICDFVDILSAIKNYDPAGKIVFGDFADLTDEQLLTVTHLTIPEFVLYQNPLKVNAFIGSATKTIGIITAYQCGDKTFRI